eukprot:GFUD01031751.1.p1 GENE.GFUD01031751.1~~GFUD01031751.1.p1  ORF type:complete len:164 (+),score=35.16 GFUD01031751.1:54-545(+)
MFSKKSILDCSDPELSVVLPCRSIRIGNYKVHGPKYKVVTITEKGLQIKVPASMSTPETELVTLDIAMEEVVTVLAHIGKPSTLMFLCISPSACEMVRRTLKMNSSSSLYLDVQSNNEKQKRISILPEKLTEPSKALLKKHFGTKMTEFSAREANEMMVRSAP